VQVAPVAVATVCAAFGRPRPRGIAVQPFLDLVVVELLAPQHARERLALHTALILRHVLRAELGVVEGIRLRLPQRPSTCSASASDCTVSVSDSRKVTVSVPPAGMLKV
jgi:hypothetical protein